MVADQETFLEEHAAFVAEREAFLSRQAAPATDFAGPAEAVPLDDRSSIHQPGAELAANPTQPDEAVDESSSDQGGDVFARLRTMSLLKDPDAEAEPPRPAEPAPEPETTPDRGTGRTAPAAQPPADEEESIEAYMARLLNRMRGGSDDDAPPAAARPARPAPAPAPIVEAPVAEASPNDQEPAAQSMSDSSVPAEPINMVPRGAAAPACDMAAMRALANMSVHSALSTHRKNHRRRMAGGKLALTGVAAACSCVLTYWALEGDDVIWYAAATGWILTVSCGAHAVRLSGQLLREKKSASLRAKNDEAKNG